MKSLVIWIIIIGGLGYGGSKWYLHKEVGDGMDTAVKMMSPFADVQYKGVSSTMSGKLTVDGIQVKIKGYKDGITIEKLGIDTPNFMTLLELGDIASSIRSSAADMPEYIGFTIEGMRMPVDADYYQTLYNAGISALGVSDTNEPAVQCVGKYGYSPAALAGLGYDEQNISVAVYLRKATSSFVINMIASTENMWAANIDVTFAGDMQTEMAKGAQVRPRMKQMLVELNDHSLNDRVRRYCKTLGLSEEETLKAQLNALKYFGDNNGIEFDEYLIDPYVEYLGGKKKLTITADPIEPVNFSQLGLYKPSDVPALLNLAAVAE